MATAPRFALHCDDDARRSPIRVVVVQGDRMPAVDADDEPMVMTVPHLLVREAIAFVGLSLGLVVVALLFDAPLEELANPEKTPNPAKAPWYFLGLQELLHYYPPLISGVVLPGLVVLALVVVPHFDINWKREAFWHVHRAQRLGGVSAVVAVLSVVLLTTGAHPVWPMVIPIWDSEARGYYTVAGILGAGIGAGVGAIIDAVRRPSAKPSSSARPRVDVSPTVSRHVRGALVTVRY
ncbi:MAG: hypothetical protein FJW27_01110 [Acidimicrobiia bacterium]|nr:hypothetical protein [Acidimicrobiia bacterium]